MTPKEKLRTALPHLRYAAKMAQEKTKSGTIELAIISKNPDGTGQVGACFRADEFLDDLAAVLEITPEEAAEGELEAKAEAFMQSLGLKRGVSVKE